MAGVRAECEFIVPDVTSAAEYYRDVLGFRILGYFQDPPVFAMVARDAVAIHVGKADNAATASPNAVRRRGLGLDAYIWVNDLDALHAELQGRGAKIIEARPCASTTAMRWWSRTILGFTSGFSMDFQQPGS